MEIRLPRPSWVLKEFFLLLPFIFPLFPWFPMQIPYVRISRIWELQFSFTAQILSQQNPHQNQTFHCATRARKAESKDSSSRRVGKDGIVTFAVANKPSFFQVLPFKTVKGHLALHAAYNS